jgi:hypothetical protein
VSLAKVLRLAAAEEAAHDHLMRECNWYGAVSDGHPAMDPDDHCPPKFARGGVVTTAQARGSDSVTLLLTGCEYRVRLTPHTAEASTVDKPTVPPGGPGLFHHKGLHLPPYIQHLWFHLKDKYGKHQAYGMAVGIVKKWAAGVNPGGWKTKSGKGKRTHPDVKAAAQRNVAEWEKDRTEGGNKRG